ncbi:S8 family serine peptidase [Mycoplasma sp. B6400]|uniref:S8 family serine peptidase n=1 Tax=Mycoplasma sp. B6400 TaxID=3401674 RepID=UPI003AAEAB1E
MNKIKKYILTLMTSTTLTAITVATTMSASVNEENRINKFSDIKISKSELNSIKDIYKTYFDWHKIDKSLLDSNYDLTESYSKVGIIELNGLKKSDIINTKVDLDNFHIHGGFIDESSNNNTSHGSKVYSLVSSDFGVNDNANVYYSNLNVISQSNISSEEKQKILSKYPDIETNVYSQLKNSLDYMVKNGVKVANLSLGWNLLGSSVSDNELDTLSKIEDYLINNKSINNSDTKDSPVADLYWLNKIYKIQNFSGISNLMLDEILDYYNKKYGITVIAAAGNDGTLYSDLKYYMGRLAKYKNFNDLLLQVNIEAIKMRFTMTNKMNNTNMSIMLNAIIELATSSNRNSENLNNLISMIKSNEKESYQRILEKYNDVIKTTIGNNIIYVGSVGEKMRPSEFSTFTTFENDNLPLISSFGEAIKKETNSGVQRYSSNDHINSLIEYYYSTEGTSFSAPIITGMISLLQQIFHKTFTLAEIKALLAYSAQISEHNLNMYTDDEYSSDWYIKNSHRYGVRRKNNSFSKIGFGVPDFRKMYNAVKHNNLRKIKVTDADFNINGENFEFDDYPYESSARYTIVVSYNNINPVNDKNGFLWYLARKKDSSEKYWDFLMYCMNNLKNKDILNLDAVFSYHTFYQNWFDYYNYYPEESDGTTHSRSNSNTASIEKVWIDMPVYGQDDEMYMKDYNAYISFVFLNELKRVYDNYMKQESELDERMTWEECKQIMVDYINSLDITYIITTDYINDPR